jgi:hypothetical protein
MNLRLRLRLRLQLALGVAVALGGLIATRAAIAEKRVETARSEGIAALLAQIEALAPAKGHSTLHVTFNGVAAVVAFEANTGSVDEAARLAVASCGGGDSGSEGVANGDVPLQRRETREAVSREDARDASAVVCLTRGKDGSRTSRMTFVQAASTTTLTTKDASVDAMFPREGDVPGDDLAMVRPADSRRVGAASVLETGHAVRMYDLAHPSPGDISLDELDVRMKAQGFVSSAGVAREVSGMRLYLRDGERLVASFERDSQGNVARVTIARVNLI